VVICLERDANDMYMVQLMPLLSHRRLLHWNPDWFNLSGAGSSRLFWKRGRQTGVLTFLLAAVDKQDHYLW